MWCQMIYDRPMSILLWISFSEERKIKEKRTEKGKEPAKYKTTTTTNQLNKQTNKKPYRTNQIYLIFFVIWILCFQFYCLIDEKWWNNFLYKTTM